MSQSFISSRSIANWFLPPKVEESMRYSQTAIKSLLTRKYAVNKKLRGKHTGERCFILATGPSIKSQDLKSLEKEVCISVSNFFVHSDYEIIKPAYHCMAPYHPPIKEEAWQAWLNELSQKSDRTIFFFGASDFYRNQRPERFQNSQCFYMDFSGTWAFSQKHGVNLTGPLPTPQSVTIMALFASIYMGFSEIHLLGCDHDWLLHLNSSKHFYEEDKHVLVRKGYNEWHANDLESYCQDYVQLWKCYKQIQSIAFKKDIKIYNSTNGGLLDVFPLFPFEAISSNKS